MFPLFSSGNHLDHNLVTTASMASNETRDLAAAEMKEIAEYERIVEFAGQVLPGTHPRVKIPPHLVGSSFTHLIFTILSFILVLCDIVQNYLRTFSQ